MKLLLSLARSSRWLLSSATLTSAASGLGVALLVAWLNRAILVDASELPRLGAQFAALALGAFACRALSQCQFVELSQTVLSALRMRVGTHVARAPYRELELHGPARLLTVLTQDVATVSEFFVIVPRLVMYGAVLVGCAAYLAALSWHAAGFAVVAVLIGLIIERLLGRAAHGPLRRARIAEDQVMAHFRALFYGAKELKLNRARRSAFLSDVLARSVESASEERARGLTLHVRSGSQRVLTFYAVIGGVIFVVSPALELAPEVSSGYALMYLYMMLPLQALIDAIPVIDRARVALERIEALGVVASGPDDLVSPVPSFDEFDRVSLQAVTHSYRRDGDDGTFVLGPIHLELRRGEVVFLIGGNGTGKTTLAKVVTGLYAPETGQVLLNGKPVDDSAREAYRQHFTAVFSDFHLFESLLGIERYQRDERALAWLEALDLTHKVQIDAGKFSTTALSTGQRKRLALLVACLEDRPICVFDEWAADQDTAYRDVFYRQILPELKARGKAVLVITHDDRYFHCADRSFELDAGLLRSVQPACPIAPPASRARSVTSYEPELEVDEARGGTP
jgi:putative ATP-binding cassette transporter